jgi:hypothetical protein
MQSFQLGILMFATSLFTSSSHLYLGLPFEYTVTTSAKFGWRRTFRNVSTA